jgi:MerR family transcriptional regulator, copper efflux regulator
MKIGEITGRAGVSVDTVRFYERVGVLPPPARTESGYRDYEPGMIERIRLTRELQAIGFTLRDAVVLRISPPTPAPATRSRR